MTEAKWQCLRENPFKHHFLLEVSNPSYHKELTNNAAGDEEEDFMDLSGL